MKLVLNVNLYLKVFPFHMLSAWIKHQIAHTNIQGFSKAKNSALCAEFSMGSIPIFPNGKKTNFSRFIVKFLKLMVTSHSLCYIWNVNIFIICKLNILFSTVKCKLEYNFSQFIHRCLNVALAGILSFSQFMIKLKNLFFWKEA